MQEIPDEVIKLADERTFPIIELNEDVRLGDIVNHTLSHILDKRTAELEQAIAAQKVHKPYYERKSIQSLLHNVSAV
ncbi:hypothetical protein PO124_07280 [Bacillus licheniformis]|nr:hypothetical protein [Bacillus licheniformis]